jgi:hypothetical protein
MDDLKENSDVDHQARHTRRSGHSIMSAFFPVSSPVPDWQRHCCGFACLPAAMTGAAFEQANNFNPF